MSAPEVHAPATADAERLLAIADSVVGRATGNEQVEVVVVADRGTEVRVYDGDVESLSSADTAGIGVRVVDGGRQGFAWAGTLDADAVDAVLAEARDNLRFASVDEFAGLAEPDGVTPPHLELFDPAADSMPTADKVALAIELERATYAADARISRHRERRVRRLGGAWRGGQHHRHQVAVGRKRVLAVGVSTCR